MAGGTLSLTGTRGVGQDVININPQITFFKKVYKRHTNFGIEAIQQSSTTLQYGQSTEINIAKTGSLITDMHIEFTLPPAAGGNGVKDNGKTTNQDALADHGSNGTGVVSRFLGYARWVNAVGFAIIKEIQLKFGSTILDKHTGLWYDVWNELTDPNRKEWPLVGKFTDLERQNHSDWKKTRYYLPLKFYFNRNPGLALPIFLLNENELKINISFNSLESLLNFNTGNENGDPVITNRELTGFKFYVNYVFLEAEEEARIQNSLPSEYLVETLDIKDNITAATATNMVFENPTKELIWVFRHNSRLVTGTVDGNTVPKFNNPSKDTDTHPNDIFNYSKKEENTSLGYGTKDTFNNLIIKINNTDRFTETDATFFRTMQPYKYHSNIPGGISKASKKQYIYVYSFALNPEEYQPTGSYNFSLGDDLVTFSFNGPNRMNEDYSLTIFSLRYEYIVFNFGRVTISRVPIQSTFQEAQQASSSAKADPTAIAITASKNTAVKEEIKRRYGTEVPYLNNQSIGKKQWSGLQGQFFQKQKSEDLGEEYENKKKDIF